MQDTAEMPEELSARKAQGGVGGSKMESPLEVETTRTKRSIERLETVVSDLTVKLSPITPQEPSDPVKDGISDGTKDRVRGSSMVTTLVREMGDKIGEQTRNLRTLLKGIEL